MKKQAVVIVRSDRRGNSPTEDLTVSATISIDPAHFSQDSNVYTIHDATGWDVFCDCLQDNDAYNRFTGKTVLLADDITVTRMAGGSGHDFKGIFDGQRHTLTVAYGTTDSPVSDDDKAAPFRNVESGCVIKKSVHPRLRSIPRESSRAVSSAPSTAQ